MECYRNRSVNVTQQYHHNKVFGGIVRDLRLMLEDVKVNNKFRLKKIEDGRAKKSNIHRHGNAARIFDQLVKHESLTTDILLKLIDQLPNHQKKNITKRLDEYVLRLTEVSHTPARKYMTASDLDPNATAQQSGRQTLKPKLDSGDFSQEAKEILEKYHSHCAQICQNSGCECVVPRTIPPDVKTFKAFQSLLEGAHASMLESIKDSENHKSNYGTGIHDVKSLLYAADGPIDVDQYVVRSYPQGGVTIAIVIVNIYFANLPTRNGADNDGNRIISTFNSLGYTVVAKNNLTANEMLKLITDTIANYGYINKIVVAISSHGEKGGLVYGIDDKPLLVQDVLDEIDIIKAPHLSGIPKLFILQACRGNKRNPINISIYERVIFTHSKTQKVYIDPLAQIPRTSAVGVDVCVFYATRDNFLALRNTITGSNFVIILCDILESPKSKNLEIAQIAKIVTRKTIYSFLNLKAMEVPEITSTMRFDCILRS